MDVFPDHVIPDETKVKFGGSDEWFTVLSISLCREFVKVHEIYGSFSFVDVTDLGSVI